MLGNGCLKKKPATPLMRNGAPLLRRAYPLKTLDTDSTHPLILSPSTMPKIGSDAYTTTDCHRLSLSYLRKKGVLQPGSAAIILLWGKGRRVSISFEVLSEVEEPYLHVQYTWKKKPRNYWLELVPVVSPISFPYPARYLLVCPASGRRTTALYLHPHTGKLLCREAWGPGRLYYPSQLVTERMRYFYRQFVEDEAMEKIWDRPHRKLFYQGKPTRKFAAVLTLTKRLGLPPPITGRSKRAKWVQAFWEI